MAAAKAVCHMAYRPQQLDCLLVPALSKGPDGACGRLSDLGRVRRGLAVVWDPDPTAEIHVLDRVTRRAQLVPAPAQIATASSIPIAATGSVTVSMPGIPSPSDP